MSRTIGSVVAVSLTTVATAGLGQTMVNLPVETSDTSAAYIRGCSEPHGHPMPRSIR